MITEFELRLADVLGARLPAPFGGRVRVAPGDPPGPQPGLTLGVVRADRLAEPLGGAPPRVAPGAPLPRRVVSLRCTIALDVRAGTGQGRAQQMRGVDATLDALEDSELRRGTALGGDAADPGFKVHALGALDALVPLEGPVRVEAFAEGIFWPVGAAGATGIQIGEIRLRGVALPIAVTISDPPVVGGPAIDITVDLGGPAKLDLKADEPPASLPFGRVAVALSGPGGRPGAGTLGGGAAGADDGTRVILLRDDGTVRATYTPPAAPARDELIVALDDGAGGAGVELGRLALEVKE